jgi:hypothetical protein
MTEKEKLMIEEMMYRTNLEADKQAAESLYKMYVEYKKAGFTPAQAVSLVKGVLLTAVETNIRITRG